LLLLQILAASVVILLRWSPHCNEQPTIAFAANRAASVVSLLRWSPDEQPTIAFAANPCTFCRESFAVISWQTSNDCFCCESLRLLLWVFCGDRLIVTNNQRSLLLRILPASVVSLSRWSPGEQLMIAFAVNHCGGDRLIVMNNQRFLLLRILAASLMSLLRWSPDEQLTIAFAANPSRFCIESFVGICYFANEMLYWQR